jgi:two-component system chemotaxis response regulator CheB
MPSFKRGGTNRYSLLALGASWGGVEALSHIIEQLPADWSVPIVIVQHQHAHSGTALERILSRLTTLKVVDVEDKQLITPGHIYIAPANYHLLVEEDKSFSLSLDAPVLYSRPSIDVTFRSLAGVYGSQCIAVLLTGANEDGVDGLRKIRASGGFTMAQDPKEAMVATMPQAAITADVVDKIVLLNEVVPETIKLLLGGTE